jgi:hypothetical protein
MSTKRISITRDLDGVPTDYASVPVLRDPTLTYGVKRVDTSAVIVLAGTEFTRDSAGRYHYDVTGLTEGVDYLAYIERVNAGGGIQRDPFSWTAGVDEAEGYYVKRAKTLRTAGTVNFNAAFNLDPTSLAADESIVQEVFDQADRFVDGRALVLGVTAAGTPPHFVCDHRPDLRHAQRLGVAVGAGAGLSVARHDERSAGDGGGADGRNEAMKRS